MGQQVGFFADQEDYISLLQTAENIGFLALTKTLNYDPEDYDIKTSLPTELLLRDTNEEFYLLPNSFSVVEAFYEEGNSEPPVWVLMDHVSPVVQFKPSLQNGKNIDNGRIYLNIELDDPRRPIVEKMYSTFSKIIRQWERTDRFGFYVGPHTAKLARQGDISLKHFRHELNVV
jgi:hypothetical protein